METNTRYVRWFSEPDLGILKTNAPLVLYGHLTVTEPLAAYLAQRESEVFVVTKEMSESAAVHGAALL